MRGVLHEIAFFASLVVGALLILGADGARTRLVAAVFSASVAACLGTSALYHRRTWTPHVRLLMRRFDHAGVYVLIAGTYTPVSVLVLRGAWRPTILLIVWIGALAAIVLKFVWAGSPKWLAVAIALALGWAAVAVLPQLIAHLDAAAVTLLVAGGLVYTAGGIIYARRRPDPVPHVFGYHELFHALTILALTCQYIAIAFFVVHAG